MLSTLVLLAALQGTPAADSLSGRWRITGDVAGNPLDQTCTLKQTGATLSGSCIGQAGETLPLTGELKDGKVILRHGGDYQGQALTIIYTATSVSAKALKGTMEGQPFGASGTFSAVPTAAPTKP